MHLLSKTLGELGQIRHLKKKKNSGDFTPVMSKSLQILDHFFPLLLHKDSEYLRSWDIGHWELGARRRLNGVNKFKKIRQELVLPRQF